MDWDHLRFFLVLARAGTLVNAARQLQVDHTTVSRRIQALEKQMGAALFSRDRHGQQLTEAGRRLWTQAQAMEVAFSAIENQSLAGHSGIAGLVRVGAPEGLGVHVLAAPLAQLAQQHPGLTVDLLALSRLVHLSRREADIVISLERPSRGSVVVTKLCDYGLRLYGATAYLSRHPPIRCKSDLARHGFVSYVDDMLFTRQLLFLESFYRPERFALRSTSIQAQVQAVRAGHGLGILPAFLADGLPELQVLLPDEAFFQRTFWMSIPSEIRHLDRMKLVWDFLRQTVQAHCASVPEQAKVQALAEKSL